MNTIKDVVSSKIIEAKNVLSIGEWVHINTNRELVTEKELKMYYKTVTLVKSRDIAEEILNSVGLSLSIMNLDSKTNNRIGVGYTEEYKKEVIKAYRSSKCTVSDFLKEYGISYSTLDKWRKKYK
jgi:uncharacterized membrane-anchored protein YjiN (DUF445 family)